MLPSPARRSPELLAPVLCALAGAAPTAVVLIDGPSGAGKSTLADRLVAAWPGELTPTLVRLDDIYPGWNGLAAGIQHLATHVLEPRRDSRPAAWQRFDWVRGEPAEWHTVDASLPLVIEGCGALADSLAPLGDIRIWLAADDSIRKTRALDRDGEAFRSHWDQWQDEWEAYRAADAPERWATIRLDSTGGLDSTDGPVSTDAVDSKPPQDLRPVNERETPPPD